MTACVHTPRYPDLGSIPTQQEATSHCSVVEDDEKVAKMRALTSADGGTTKIDAPYWRGLDEAQRAAVIAHERAHPSIGMEVDCEGCADKVGGYFMRAWGYAPPVVRSSFGSLSVQRQREHGNIADNAFAGASAAEKALAGRGLLGKPTSTVTQTLLGLRVPVAPATPVVPTTAAVPAPRSPVRPAPGPAVVTDGTKAEAGPPEVNAGTEVDVIVEGGRLPPTPPERDALGDVVSSVLGEAARPHAGKVLIAMGVAAILAVVVVVVVRRSK